MEAFGPFSESYFRYAMHWYGFFCCGPLVWDKEKAKVVVSQSRRQWVWWMLNLALSFSYKGFLLFRVGQYMSRSDKESELLTPVLILSCCYVFISGLYEVTQIVFYEEFPFLMKCVNDLMAALNANLTRQPSKTEILLSDRFGFYFWCMQIWFFTLEVGIFCLLLTVPEYPLTLTSVLEKPEDTSLWLRILLLLPILYVLLFNQGTMAVMAFLICPGIFVGPQLLKEVRLGEASYKTVGSLRTFQSFFVWYKAGYIFNGVGKSIYAPFMGPAFHWLLVTLDIFAIYSAITNERTLMLGISILLGSYTTTVLIIVFSQIAALFHDSVSTVESWRRRRLGKWQRKSVKSLRYLKVTVRSYYFIDRGLVLTMVGTIFENVIGLLASRGKLF